jgi:hypothetical protein
MVSAGQGGGARALMRSQAVTIIGAQGQVAEICAREAHAVGRGEEGGGGAVAVGGDQLNDLALVEALAQASRTFRAGSRGAHRAGERHGVAKL